MSEDYIMITDAALRVVVTPSHFSYFGGEPPSAAIIIANTRSPQAPQVMPPRPTHERSAHSVGLPDLRVHRADLSWPAEEPLEHIVSSDTPKVFRTNTQRLDRNSAP